MRLTIAMSPLAIRSLIRRSRRRLAVLAVFGLLTGAVAAHHLPGVDLHMDSAGVVCLAVLQIAVGVALVALPRPVRRLRSVRLFARPSVAVPEPITVPARAGPSELQVLRL
jgi:hypothetical protein